MRNAKRRHSGSSCVSYLSHETGAKPQVANFQLNLDASKEVTNHARGC